MPIWHPPHGSMRPFNPNPFLGRVGYTHAAGVDQPLSVIRSGYVDRRTRSGGSADPMRWGVFAMFPLWSPRGQVELAVYPDGGLFRCASADRCVRGTWLGHHFVLERPKVQLDAWQGTLIEDKRDAAGTLYRRNRYLDPRSGRFTQEDPIGLAGGMNLYGFAEGDPVNFSDPYGLFAEEAGDPPSLRARFRAFTVRTVQALVTAAGFGEAPATISQAPNPPAWEEQMQPTRPKTGGPPRVETGPNGPPPDPLKPPVRPPARGIPAPQGFGGGAAPGPRMRSQVMGRVPNLSVGARFLGPLGYIPLFIEFHEGSKPQRRID